jgi:predicted RNA methylase
MREAAAHAHADAVFDQIYPPEIQAVSRPFWTPVRVAARAAELLVTSPTTRVLDVGAGVGKFCIVGAAVTGATFVGVERRPRLVQIARRAAEACGVPSVSFLCAEFHTLRVKDFDALYFFNPFEENLWDPPERLDRLDDADSACPERFVADIGRAERMLLDAKPGTRVATYHGFGGRMVHGYDLVHSEEQGTGVLQLWVRRGHRWRVVAPARGD